MGCFKAVLGKLKKDLQKKMGNMPTLKINDGKFERMSDERSSRKSLGDFVLPDLMEGLSDRPIYNLPVDSYGDFMHSDLLGISGRPVYKPQYSKQSRGAFKHPDDENPRVPMDFTQGRGRIVHDAAEIEQIMREVKQGPKPDRLEKYERFPKEALEHGRHLTQKYYHGVLSRPDAEKLLQETFTNGAWLLRDSFGRTNCLTLSYLYEGRVHHKYISAASYFDKSTGQCIYVATLDQQLAFYDVHSLIEFYRLNKGETMSCMLTTSVKKVSQRDNSPPRSLSNVSPSKIRPAALNLTAGSSPQSTDSKSPRSLKDFFTKSIQKSKQALRPKKLEMSSDQPQPSTSKQDDLSSGISSAGTPDSPPSQGEPPQPQV